MSSPSVSLIISTYNKPEALGAILHAINRGLELPDEVIICDDGSGPETRAVVERWQDRLGCPLKHAWHEDQGFRKTCILNQGVAQATGDYVVFLDGDCVPTHKFVADHRKLAEPGTFVQGRRAFIVEEAVPEFLDGKPPAGLIFSGKVKGLLKGIRWPFPITLRNQKHRGLIGCNLAIWREDLVAVNGFDEAYEGWGMEDSDLCVRLYHLGRIRKFVYGRALVFHLNHPTVSRESVSRNTERLRQVIASQTVRCERGLDQYLKPAVS